MGPLAGLAGTLDDIVAAMGAAKVDTISYSGKGLYYAVGQSARADMPWPRFNLVRYSATADFENAALREEKVLTQGEDPPRGGGRQPVTGELRLGGGIAGDKAWNGAGPSATATGAAASAHELWTSPLGIVKLALLDKTKVTLLKDGRTEFWVERAGRFKARATVSRQNLVERVDSWIGNPVLGDMAVIKTFSDYKDHGGVMFPTRIAVVTGGHPSLDLTVTEVKVNAGGVTPPERIATPSREMNVDKVADGVWYLTGGSHHSVAIEMADHAIVVEGPLNDGRANGVIGTVKSLIPGKPIRYVVNTHHHFDHSGGLRAFVADGATIVTHESNKAFYEQAYAAPRRLAPDRLSRSGAKAQFQTVADKAVLSDGKRSLEIPLVQGNLHNDGLLIAYLPAEKIMIVADAFSHRRRVDNPASHPSPFTTNLWDNVVRLKLDIATILPIHGGKAGLDQLKLQAGVR